MEGEDIKMLVKKWWDIYDDESLDFKNIVAAAEAGNGTEQVTCRHSRRLCQRLVLSISSPPNLLFLKENEVYVESI
ncbi:unnamed protein product [Prunus armeniaca]